jgi:glutamate synthase (NADPH/NADH) small chain
MRTSSSHEEGCERRWSVCTKKFSGGAGIRADKLHGCQVEWIKKSDGWKMKGIPGTDFTLKADLVLLALGFVHVVHEGLIKDLGLQLDEQGSIAADNYQTSQPWVFAAGDAVSGASLVVHAIDSGRQAATAIDQWLKTQI